MPKFLDDINGSDVKGQFKILQAETIINTVSMESNNYRLVRFPGMTWGPSGPLTPLVPFQTKGSYCFFPWEDYDTTSNVYKAPTIYKAVAPSFGRYSQGNVVSPQVTTLSPQWKFSASQNANFANLTVNFPLTQLLSPEIYFWGYQGAFSSGTYDSVICFGTTPECSQSVRVTTGLGNTGYFIYINNSTEIEFYTYTWTVT